MEKFIKGLFLLFFVLFFRINSVAQSISIPYSCGFEDSVEISSWHLNSGADGENCLDQWMVGNLDCNEGYNSLYVSCDSGVTNSYGAKPNMVIAYRAVEIPSTLDTLKQTYSVNVSFDWKCLGEAQRSVLKFYFLPETVIAEGDLKSNSHSDSLPSKLARLTPTATLSGSLDWNNFAISNNMRVDRKFLIVFVWQNNNINVSDTTNLKRQSVCIDNVEITSGACPKPENLQTTLSICDTLKVSWDGVAEQYEFEYRPSGDKNWGGNIVLSDKSIVIPNIAEGAYDVRVRGIFVDNQKSAWTVKNGAICFCPDRHCINYVDLDREGVICEKGKAINPLSERYVLEKTNLGQSGAGPIDYGANDSRSRHTVNWQQEVYDPRTGNKLRVIPKGALASVRLGNWENGAEAESITYDYYVDTTQADIVLMKYAVVLENPGHGREEDPYFRLEILDQNGMPIDQTCGEFDFSPQDNDVDWNEYYGYVWRDWTSIGLNLAKYHNQTIQIRLLTQDCTPTAHAGYAYFTLDCADAAIESASCGDTEYMEMVAPEGFRYIWTSINNRDSVISTEQSISVPAGDTTTYFCEVDYIDVTGCGFTLFTSVSPRFPFADFVSEWKPEDCENRMLFTNKSCVHTRIEGVEMPTSEKCESFKWFVNGEYVSPLEDFTYVASPAGDSIEVTFIAGISGDACQDDTTFTVVIPAIYEHYDTLYETMCAGTTRLFGDQLLATSGVYTDFDKNIWGCDSITELYLTVVPLPEDVHINETICSNGLFVFEGDTITESGDYRFILKTKETGCDSVVFVHLQVIDAFDVDVSLPQDWVCADGASLDVDIDFIDALHLPSIYSIEYDSLAHSAGFVDVNNASITYMDTIISLVIPEGCRPNTYTASIIFKDTTAICGDLSFDVSFDVYYSSTLLQPKFGNLITVLDETTNGGYSFVDGEYIWFLNGDTIPGINTPYLYLPEGEVFKESDCYYLVVKREDDGVVTRSCEICPAIYTDIDDIYSEQIDLFITSFAAGQPFRIDNFNGGKVYIYSITGVLLSEYIVEDNLSYIEAPMQEGFYIVYLESSQDTKVFKIRVK